MAKFLPGPTVATISGSIGGTTYSRNRYGAYMRFRAKPVVSTTGFAVAAKARMTAATQSWQGLTEAQRLAWNAFAANNPVPGALGMSQQLTGHVAFVGNFCRADLIQAATLTDPPVTPAPLPLTALNLTCDIGAGNIEAAYTASPTGAAELLWLQACIIPNASIKWVENRYRFIGVSGAAEASPYDMETQLTARIGVPSVGQYLHVKAHVVNNTTFLLSAPLTNSVICTTT